MYRASGESFGWARTKALSAQQKYNCTGGRSKKIDPDAAAGCFGD
jgi:hypothetical protein